VNSPLDLLARVRKPMLVHWVGTDVEYALRDHASAKASRRVLERGLHRADAPWLIEELQPLGMPVEERLLPIPVTLGESAELPQSFRVLIYLPREPGPQYDIEAIMEVVQRLPAVEFAIAGGYRPEEKLANMTVLGFVIDMPGLYLSCVAMLRLMKHDGMSHSVIEAASFGRYVVWNYPAEGVETADGAEAAVEALARLKCRFDRGELLPDDAAAGGMRAKYNDAQVLAQISADLDRLLT
jgi:hypothetical protein